jgi:hypothetical protein
MTPELPLQCSQQPVSGLYPEPDESILHSHLQTTNSVALVSKRTIPTERTPLVGEVSANFCG